MIKRLKGSGQDRGRWSNKHTSRHCHHHHQQQQQEQQQELQQQPPNNHKGGED